MRYLIAVGFLSTTLLANYATSTWGMVPVGFGLVATAGTYFAGLSFVLRDSVQDAYGKRWAITLVVIGALLSYLVADPFIALASGVAFLVAELADLAVYTPLRKRGYIRAAIASNIVGALVDTVLFLWIAGFAVWSAVPGQMVAKVAITAVVVGVVVMARAVSRQPLRA